MNRTSVKLDDDSVKGQARAFDPRQSPNRRPARTVENREERPLGGKRLRRRVVVDRCQPFAHRTVISSSGNRDCPLSGRRQPFVSFEEARYMMAETKPRQPRCREQRSLRLPLVDLAEPRLNVAAEIDNTKVWPRAKCHRLPAERRGPDDRTFRQIRRRRCERDSQQRLHQRFVAKRSQPFRRVAGVRLGSGDQEPHGALPREKIWPA